MSRNLCSTTCHTCGHYKFNNENITNQIMTEDEYIKDIGIVKSRYRGNGGLGWRRDKKEVKFTKVICPLCGAIYAAWLYWNSECGGEWLVGKKKFAGAWDLYDLSYYQAFNDEPLDEDRGNTWDNPDVRMKIIETGHGVSVYWIFVTVIVIAILILHIGGLK